MTPPWVAMSIVAHAVLLVVFAYTNGPWHPRAPRRSLAYLMDLRGLPPEPQELPFSLGRPHAARRGTMLSMARLPLPAADTAPGDPAGVVTTDTLPRVGYGRRGEDAFAALTPHFADRRLWVRPLVIPEDGGRPITLDSVARAWFMLMADSMERHPEMSPNFNPYAPRPWTFQRNGQTYGLDGAGLHLGTFTIPTMVLALLPFPQGNVDQARANGVLMNMRADMLRAAARAQTEEDFRRAVRGIRERKDRERREQRERDRHRPPTTP